MARLDNAYSRFIALAKVLLPLAALVILSTFFLISRDVDPTASIPYAQVDVEKLIRDQGVTAPTYSTLTSDGTAITFRADRVLPDRDDASGGIAEMIRLRLDYADGSHVEVVSGMGTLDSGAEQARLKDNVVITTSDGNRLTTQVLVSDLNNAWLRSEGDVQMVGRVGTVSAGGMEIRQSETDPDHHVVDFHDGVKLVYSPQPKEDAR